MEVAGEVRHTLENMVPTELLTPLTGYLTRHKSIVGEFIHYVVEHNYNIIIDKVMQKGGRLTLLAWGAGITTVLSPTRSINLSPIPSHT